MYVLSCVQLFVIPMDCSTSRDISLSCFSERIIKMNNAKGNLKRFNRRESLKFERDIGSQNYRSFLIMEMP